ncbi:hypothetical protein HOO54_06060 [Bacillus sp. WMMC1349]|uniref:hypothetical protein n=1 Tax=Bacillus sp. WMMC1349 TaxID=2736254 RepID=UPI001553AAE1|nr:hypothetical protein [Bacillus sp. WMMC1349]NPC91810.1 hypothetical protein [Bacillus sp. WMMC1349]
MKNKKRTIMVSTLILGLILSFSTIGLAYSKGYSFDLGSAIATRTGYNYNLDNKYTTITAKADSFNVRTGQPSANEQQYAVYIAKKWSFETHNTGILTTGRRYTKNVGGVSSGDYRVQVVKKLPAPDIPDVHIIGGGNVIQ